jgi:hypothetical protein
MKMSVIGAAGIITNHLYANIVGMGGMAEMAGGGGVKYAASSIVYLSKNRGFEKTEEKNSRTGIRLRCTGVKGRKTIEGSEVWVALRYSSGLAKYYGLVDLAIHSGIWKRVSTRIELQDGSLVFEKSINREPEKYFTAEVLAACDRAASELFKYGNSDGGSIDGGEGESTSEDD